MQSMDVVIEQIHEEDFQRGSMFMCLFLVRPEKSRREEQTGLCKEVWRTNVLYHLARRELWKKKWCMKRNYVPTIQDLQRLEHPAKPGEERACGVK